MARLRVRPDHEQDPVLTSEELTKTGRHWAELALESGWDVAALCKCEEAEQLALVGGDGWYAVNMCARCRRKIVGPTIPPEVDEA